MMRKQPGTTSASVLRIGIFNAIFPPRHREPRQEQRVAAWGRREHDGMGTPPPHAALEPQWLSGAARVHTAGYVGTGLRSPLA